MKQHAKDYLKEYADSQDIPVWLKVLITEAINTNCKITSNKFEEIYQLCCENTPLIENNNISTNSSVNTNEIELHLTKLTHKNGVNALIKNGSICFSDNVTVLYGLNGSGKSSYFRILNEIAGGNNKKAIIPNIYSSDNGTIDVSVHYKRNGENESINWDNTQRGINPFTHIKVFDSSYLNGLLDKRQTDETLIYPFGLNLFKYIIEKVDELKRKLSADADKIKNEKPEINFENFSEDIKTAFKKNCHITEAQKKIERLYEFSEEDKTKLNEFNKQIQDLKQINYEDIIKVKTREKDILNSIHTTLSKDYNQLSKHISEIKTLLLNYDKYKKENKEAKDNLEVLKNLPNTDSEKWKAFIKAGKDYSNETDQDPKTCIYCGQTLNTDALEIIKAYGIFLNNNSEKLLSEIEETLEEKKRSIESLNFYLDDIDNDLKSDLESFKDNDFGKLFNFLSILKNEFYSIKDSLMKYIDEKHLKTDLKLPPPDWALTILLQLITIKEQNINDIKQNKEEKTNKIKVIQTQIQPLIDNDSVSKQKEAIKQWFDLNDKENSYKKKNDGINTRMLSSLSKTAYSELVTGNLKIKFETELKSLGFDRLEVKIETADASKGITSTKVTLINTVDIKLILSEGEQKAIALALFLAETQMQNKKNPIIFDDPVSSLDHQIAGAFAQRLLELENQVIVFTHNKLFLDVFETANNSHICKNINNGCNNKGKHIFLYNIQSEGVSLKGVVRNITINKAKNYLDEVRNLLRKSPFEEYDVASKKLRNCIECIIDEKIFNGEVPPKISNKNHRINWDKYKNLKTDPNFIDNLKKIHGRLSGGNMHNGTEQEENPITKDELDQFAEKLETLLNN